MRSYFESDMARSPFVKFGNRGPLNIQRTEGGEKIFRQTQQKSARVVDPTRRFFVKYDGKDSVDTLYDEFLEIPIILCAIPQEDGSRATRAGVRFPKGEKT
jgi:hypothetical protein